MIASQVEQSRLQPKSIVEPDTVVWRDFEQLISLNIWCLRDLLSQLHQLLKTSNLPHRHYLRIG